MTNQSSPKIFISYSHRDEDLLSAFVTHLSLLKRQNLIQTWHDRRIHPGEEWKIEIDDHIYSSQIILLLISPDFMNSDYCYDEEMTKAIELHDTGFARVIPIILRPTQWQSAPFGKLQALPKDAQPVTKWADQDDAFLDIVKQLSQIIEVSSDRVDESRHQNSDRPADRAPGVHEVSERDILEHLTCSLLRLGLLELFDRWPTDRGAPNLTDICRTLEIRSRKSAFEAVQYLVSMGLVERTSGKKAWWQLSERGRDILERLRLVGRIKIDVSVD